MCNVDRLNEAYEYLRDNGKVHTQKDLAEAMGANRISISRAFKGDKKYLTKSFQILVKSNLQSYSFRYFDLFKNISAFFNAFSSSFSVHSSSH